MFITNSVTLKDVRLQDVADVNKRIKARVSSQVTQHFVSMNPKLMKPRPPATTSLQKRDDTSSDESYSQESEEGAQEDDWSEEEVENAASDDADADGAAMRIDLRGFSSCSAAPVFKQVSPHEADDHVTPKIKCIAMRRSEVREASPDAEPPDIRHTYVATPAPARQHTPPTTSFTLSHKPSKPVPKEASYDFDMAEFDVPDVDIPLPSSYKQLQNRAQQIKSAKQQRKSREFSELFGDDVTQIASKPVVVKDDAQAGVGVTITKVPKKALSEKPPALVTRVSTAVEQSRLPRRLPKKGKHLTYKDILNQSFPDSDQDETANNSNVAQQNSKYELATKDKNASEKSTRVETTAVEVAARRSSRRSLVSLLW